MQFVTNAQVLSISKFHLSLNIRCFCFFLGATETPKIKKRFKAKDYRIFFNMKVVINFFRVPCFIDKKGHKLLWLRGKISPRTSIHVNFVIISMFT